MPRIEPQNIDAEINALGCTFLSKSALDKVCEELTSEMFYEKKHAIIFETIKSLRNKDIAVDITTVANEVSKSPNGLSSIGGYEYLTEIIWTDIYLTRNLIQGNIFAEIFLNTDSCLFDS